MEAKKILVVDDNQDSRELVIKVLKQKRRCRLYEAVDGEEALRKVAEERPDLILMDISLPKIDGYEVTRRLKGDKNFAAIPIIALTAHAMKGDMEKALSAGCQGYISKPINVHDFYDRIKTYLD